MTRSAAEQASQTRAAISKPSRDRAAWQRLIVPSHRRSPERCLIAPELAVPSVMERVGCDVDRAVGVVVDEEVPEADVVRFCRFECGAQRGDELRVR